MKKILLILIAALTATLGVGESEPLDYVFPLDELEHHAVVSIQAAPFVSVPLPWDAYRVTERAEWDCVGPRDAECYFIPDVDKDTVYFAVGRYMNSEGHRALYESAYGQSWGLFPNDGALNVAAFSFFGVTNGTVVIVSQR